MSEALAEAASESAERLEIPPILHLLALFGVFLGLLVYPFTGSRGTNLLAGLILLAYLGARNVLRRPLRGLQSWLAPRERMKNVFLAVAVIVFFAGAVEAMGHVVTRAGWIEPYSAIRTQLPQGVADFRHFHVTADKYRVSDPVLLWRPIDRWPYNRQRMKGPVAEMPKPEGLLRIMSFGDSNTDGTNDDSWSAQLQQLLDRRGDRTYQVVNAGVAGYSSYQGLLRFRQTVRDFEPDLIFVSFGWNDAAPAVNGPDKSYRPAARWLIAAERLLLRYRFFRALKTLQLPDEHPDARLDEPKDVDFPPRVSLDDYRSNLRSFLREADDAAVMPVYLTRPYSLPRAAFEQSEDMRRRVPPYNDVLRDFAAETGAVLVDVHQRFAVERHPEIQSLFLDDSHLNEAGRMVLAELLLRRLEAEGLLPAADPSVSHPAQPSQLNET